MDNKHETDDQPYSATVYHDGECPICNVEINQMKRLDKTKKMEHLPYFRRAVPIVKHTPFLLPLMEWGYVKFAKYRLKLTGKSPVKVKNDISKLNPAGNNNMDSKHYLITGGSGFIGSHLIPQLLAENNTVTVLTRSPAKTLAQFNNTVEVVDDLLKLDLSHKVDVIINLA